MACSALAAHGAATSIETLAITQNLFTADKQKNLSMITIRIIYSLVLLQTATKWHH
jgi:hypothetical protein